MTTTLKTGLAAAVLAVAAIATPAVAADLGRGSVKDGYAPAPSYAPSAPSIAGPCYFRSDIGYSWGRNDASALYVGNAADPVVRGEDLGNTHLIEGGLGCGMGSRGFRAEMVLGMRGDRKFNGDVDIVVGPGPVDPPIHTHLKTYTMMFNAYKDLGKYGNVTPYLGAGVGVAYHIVDETYFTGNPNLTNRIEGNRDIAFAWSLMAGIGYQLSDRAILDVGYRYLDLGEAETGRVDNAGFVNPRVELDDLASHEIKVGLRYHFGQSDCCAAEYAPMK